jgi:hypothetical protein
MDVLLDVIWGAKSDPERKEDESLQSSGVASRTEAASEAKEPAIAVLPPTPSSPPMVLRNAYGAQPSTPDSAVGKSPIQLKEAAEIVANLPGMKPENAVAFFVLPLPSVLRFSLMLSAICDPFQPFPAHIWLLCDQFLAGAVGGFVWEQLFRVAHGSCGRTIYCGATK